MTQRALFALLFVATYSGCSRPETTQKPRERSLVSASTVPLRGESWPIRFEAPGTVRARATVALSAKWTGHVREVKVSVGDHVHEGQLVVTLDSRDLDIGADRATASREEIRSGVAEAESAITAAKIQLELVQTTFRRIGELHASRSVSDQEFDEASSRVKAAEAGLEHARARRAAIDSSLARAEQDIRSAQVNRSYAEIVAPFSGTVIARQAETGTLAGPGTPLISIESDDRRLEVGIEESQFGAIRVGTPVTVALDGPGMTIEGRIASLDPSFDTASRTFTAKVDLPRVPWVRSGMFGRAIFQLGARPVIAVPADAITKRDQVQSVFVAEDGVARLRLITTGERSGGKLEALSGLAIGELVVVPVPRDLADGDRIGVRQ